jgi:hypothetical protein
MGSDGVPLLPALLVLAGFFGMAFFPAPVRKVLAFAVFQAGLALYAFSLSDAMNPLGASLGYLIAGAGIVVFFVLLGLGRRAEGEAP